VSLFSKRLALALALTGGVGCDRVVKEVFTAPTVSFQGVRMGSLTLNGSTLYVELGIHNPNRFTMSATHTDYRLLVDDTIEVGHGQSNDTLIVAPRDSASATLPLDLSWKALTRAGGGALAAGEVNYRITGTITVATPVGPHDIPLNARGRFSPLKPKK